VTNLSQNVGMPHSTTQASKLSEAGDREDVQPEGNRHCCGDSTTEGVGERRGMYSSPSTTGSGTHEKAGKADLWEQAQT